MNTNYTLKSVALAALAATMLLQTSVSRADDEGKRDEHGQQAKITFTKHGVSTVPVPGLIMNMVGVGEGDAGDVLFTGEVLKTGPVPRDVVALYHFTGTKYSFSALIKGSQPFGGVGAKGEITGVVTEGWLKGHLVKGEWTVIAPCYTPGTGVGNCFEVTLEIQRDSRD